MPEINNAVALGIQQPPNPGQQLLPLMQLELYRQHGQLYGQQFQQQEAQFGAQKRFGELVQGGMPQHEAATKSGLVMFPNVTEQAFKNEKEGIALGANRQYAASGGNPDFLRAAGAEAYKAGVEALKTGGEVLSQKFEKMGRIAQAAEADPSPQGWSRAVGMAVNAGLITPLQGAQYAKQGYDPHFVAQWKGVGASSSDFGKPIQTKPGEGLRTEGSIGIEGVPGYTPPRVNLPPPPPPDVTSRPPIRSSATTVGDDEAVRAGLYEPTPDQRRRGVVGPSAQPRMPGVVTPTPALGDVESAKDAAARFGKRYESVEKIGSQAEEVLPQLELAKKLVNSPDFYSGIGAGYVDTMKRLAVTVGLDPNKAMPNEIFDKIRAGSILDQIKGMAGTGPVRVAEMKFIDTMIANRENTPSTLRTLIELESRLAGRAKEVRDMAYNYNGGNLNAGFDKAVAKFKTEHPLFSDAEMRDPRLIAPPAFQNAQEAKAAGLPSGTPIKIGDQWYKSP